MIGLLESVQVGRDGVKGVDIPPLLLSRMKCPNNTHPQWYAFRILLRIAYLSRQIQTLIQ